MIMLIEKNSEKIILIQKIIRLLSDYGVDLYVCSQATAYKKIKKSDKNKNITEALSGSSVLLNYQLNGYALMQ